MVNADLMSQDRRRGNRARAFSKSESQKWKFSKNIQQTVGIKGTGKSFIAAAFAVLHGGEHAEETQFRGFPSFLRLPKGDANGFDV
jgi:hypothetical protein